MKTEFDRMIDERMESSGWDRMISKKVFAHRSRKKKIIASVGGFAAAASLAVILSFTLAGNRTESEITGFMTAQINGSMSDAKLVAADMDFFAIEE